MIQFPSKLVYLRGSVIEWISNGRRYREHGPAAIDVSGTVGFLQTHNKYGHYTRKVGPAVIRPDGLVSYCTVAGGTHRIDGPALIYADGSKEYWINGKRIPADTFFLKYGVL